MYVAVMYASAALLAGPRVQAPDADPPWWVCVRGLIALGFLVALALTPVLLVVRSRRRKAAVRQAQEAADQARWNALVQRFGMENAGRIARREVWAGQTVEMVREARGAPVAVDEEVLKTKTKLTLKYDMIGRNRYGTRVYVENGIVVGWDYKG